MPSQVRGGDPEPGQVLREGAAQHAASLLEFPLLAAHGAMLLHLLLCFEPLEDAVHVEAVRALAPHQRAVVTRHLT
jgi:hypothetical protein